MKIVFLFFLFLELITQSMQRSLARPSFRQFTPRDGLLIPSYFNYKTGNLPELVKKIVQTNITAKQYLLDTSNANLNRLLQSLENSQRKLFYQIRKAYYEQNKNIFMSNTTGQLRKLEWKDHARSLLHTYKSFAPYKNAEPMEKNEIIQYFSEMTLTEINKKKLNPSAFVITLNAELFVKGMAFTWLEYDSKQKIQFPEIYLDICMLSHFSKNAQKAIFRHELGHIINADVVLYNRFSNPDIIRCMEFRADLHAACDSFSDACEHKDFQDQVLMQYKHSNNYLEGHKYPSLNQRFFYAQYIKTMLEIEESLSKK